jgi:hypothetical protein
MKVRHKLRDREGLEPSKRAKKLPHPCAVHERKDEAGIRAANIQRLA